MKYKIEISFSRYDIDSWEEGKKVNFIIDTEHKMSKDSISAIADTYLKSIGVNYREYMYRVSCEDSEGMYIRV